MGKSAGNQRLKLTFKGDVFPDGAVPVSLLASKLQSLQNLLFHVAATIANDASARRGRWADRYGDVAELTYVESHHSELTIEVDVGRPTALLLPELDPREQSLDLLFGFGDWIQRGCEDVGEIDRRGVSKDHARISCGHSTVCCPTTRTTTKSN